ncbi:Uroporphyrinogen decarboxylase, partial [Pseudolycoriella hygida]
MDNPTKYLDEVKTKWAAKLAERDYVTTKDAPLLKYFDMKLESYPYGNYLVNLPNHKDTNMNPLIQTFKKNNVKTPIWLMRQAGRHLPEYRKIRDSVSNFLELCYDAEKATEITLQPIARYDTDAAIIFSDILILPDALGWEVRFAKDHGPLLQQFQKKEDFKYFRELDKKKLNKIYEIIKKVKDKLPANKALIGFAGSPWTLMTYMLEGRGKQNFQISKTFIYKNNDLAQELVDFLTEKTIIHLIGQIEAGVDLIQLFDSWAGVLGEEEYDQFVVQPTKKIVQNLRQKFPSLPIIGFPKGSGFLYENYIDKTEVDAISADQFVPVNVMKNWSKKIIVQGNLDPFILLTNKQLIERKVRELMVNFKEKNFIFNLGHGILPETPVENLIVLENLPIEIIKKKVAIVLLNLGGPSSLREVKQFLFNLFYDRAIINFPNPLRFIVAKLISNIREKKSQQLYSLIGGKSPILQETEFQRLAITKKLKQVLSEDFKTFIAMRYSSPTSQEVVDSIIEYNPSEIILLPLYPQFSTTTTKSSIEDFITTLGKNKFNTVPVKAICCYPMEGDFISSHSQAIKQSLENLKNKKNYRILFSAHSLPKKIIKLGDPYQWQIEKTVEEILFKLNIKNLDYKIVYQSKLGPVKWLEPSTESEIEKAGKENKSLIIVPITFVSEHVETLVELDIEYISIARKYGIEYIRVPTLSTQALFISSLVKMISRLLMKKYVLLTLLCVYVITN